MAVHPNRGHSPTLLAISRSSSVLVTWLIFASVCGAGPIGTMWPFVHQRNAYGANERQFIRTTDTGETTGYAQEYVLLGSVGREKREEQRVHCVYELRSRISSGFNVSRDVNRPWATSLVNYRRI